MTGEWALIGLGAAGAAGVVALALRRRPRGTSLAVAGVPLATLSRIISGMEIAASMVPDATVELFGDYARDPSLMVVEVQAATEADANRLIVDGNLPDRLRELLQSNGYPPAAIPQVGLTIRSRERLAHEAAALREQEDLARWAED